jgi:SAM-dependent methyltransferase
VDVPAPGAPAGGRGVMTGENPAASADTEFGNLDANVRFLDQSGLLRPGKRILEIGSGRGTLLHLLQSRGLDIVGIETSRERIAEAQSRYSGLAVQQTSGTSLPFPDGAFDIVLSFDVFEHIRDSDAHLSEVSRVLGPGGWYLLQTPNKWTNTIFETIRWRSFTRWRDDHCALHTYGQLARRLARHGFEAQFDDVSVMTPFFREKVRTHLGAVGTAALAIVNPDRLPLPLRTNFYVRARQRPQPSL